LLDDAAPHWRTEEFHDVIRWMRSYNERHGADRLRFVGVDINGARELAYDAVTDYVGRAAPARLRELDAHYTALRPAAPIAEHIERVREQAGKQSLIDDARRAFDLVAALPADDGHALALQHARVIVGFYEFQAVDNVGFVEPRLAENTIWWHEHTGQKIVYWGGCPHTAVGEARTVSFPPAPPKTDRNAGSYLRDHFGPGYVSVGLTFDHGSVAQALVPIAVPRPSPGFADAVLGSVGLDAHLVDLRHEQSHAVRAWLRTPTTLRLIGPRYDPEHDAAYHMSGGSLGEWFDVLVHCQQTTPTRPLH
jgi:erythromycin esterase